MSNIPDPDGSDTSPILEEWIQANLETEEAKKLARMFPPGTRMDGTDRPMWVVGYSQQGEWFYLVKADPFVIGFDEAIKQGMYRIPVRVVLPSVISIR